MEHDNGFNDIFIGNIIVSAYFDVHKIKNAGKKQPLAKRNNFRLKYSISPI